jgi:hypothetical protein
MLLKLLISRAISNPLVREYCEGIIGEKIDISSVIIGDDAFVLKIFYCIFESSMGSKSPDEIEKRNTHSWILKRLVDGLGTSFPRELIHLGNLAVSNQREMNRLGGKHLSTKLISARSIKKAFEEMSAYRCDTYLYSEFPHLKKHFDVFRGSDSATFHREELYMLFEPLSIKGDDGIRAVHDAGLLIPVGRTIDAAESFRVPLLYMHGLGIKNRKKSKNMHNPAMHPEPSIVELN